MSSNKDELKKAKQQEAEQGKVILEDDGIFSKGFTQVPNAVLRDPTLSDGAKLTYSMLLSYAWSDTSSFPGQERLAHDLGKERKAVIRYIQELKNRRLVRVERRGMGLTNIYYIRTTFEADVPPVGHQEVPSMSHQEVPPVGHKEYEESNNTQIKNTKFLSKGKALKTQKERGGDTQTPTYSHIAVGAIGNGSKPEEPTGEAHANHRNQPSKPRRPGQPAPLPIGSLLQERVQHLMTQPVAAPPILPNGYTEEEDAIALYIEPYSRELGDETHRKSNVRQAINIFKEIKAEIPDIDVGHYLYILETFKNVVQYKRGVKNKMAYYFKCLRNHLWPEEAQADKLPN